MPEDIGSYMCLRHNSKQNSNAFRTEGQQTLSSSHRFLHSLILKAKGIGTIIKEKHHCFYGAAVTEQKWSARKLPAGAASVLIHTREQQQHRSSLILHLGSAQCIATKRVCPSAPREQVNINEEEHSPLGALPKPAQLMWSHCSSLPRKLLA